MKVHILLLCTVLMLQGCAGAVVVGITAIATKTATDPRTVGTQVDDATFEVRVANALDKDQQLKKGTRIINIVYHGKVLLIGQVQSFDLAKRAKQIVMSLDSATEVYNEIRQGQPISLGRMFMDIWITTKVRLQLLISDVIKSSNLKVITENGEVFLLGLVSNVKGNAAAEIVSKVNGVKYVTTAFTYL
ncbi:MAG: division/outer membrane stress-associated lipid-binding lipoprotein [Sodalis sp. (in: enterobacteria)]